MVNLTVEKDVPYLGVEELVEGTLHDIIDSILTESGCIRPVSVIF